MLEHSGFIFKLVSSVVNVFKFFFKWPDYHDFHLTQIKIKVITPIQNAISQYHIPILQHWKSNIYVKGDYIYSDTLTMSKPMITGFKYEFSAKEISPYEVPSGSEISKPLYKDVREFHQLSELRKYETLADRFVSYNRTCLDYVNGIKQELLKKSNLPEVQTGNNTQRRWINANDLSILIYDRKMGIDNRHTLIERVNTNGMREVYSQSTGQTYVQIEGSETSMIESIIRHCDELCSRQDEINKIKLDGETLLKDFLTLARDFENFEHSNRLPGKCYLISKRDYLKAYLFLGLVLIIGIAIGFLVNKYLFCKCNSVLPTKFFM